MKVSLDTAFIDPNPLEEIMATAIHEAAHAVVAVHYGIKVLEISATNPGYTQTEGKVINDLHRPTKREIRCFTRHATIALAGPVIHARMRLAARGHFSEDEKTLSMISNYFRLYKIKLDLEKCQEDATRLLQLHKSAVTALAQALIKKPVLSGKEVHELLKESRMPGFLGNFA